MRHVKRRPPATPGSIPAVLNMFESEVRFYREIAPVVGVRVPACYQAEATEAGTLLVLEDLSGLVHVAGGRLVGKVEEVEAQAAGADVLTLAHGDPSAQNLRTGPGGEVAFLDWEDVSAAPGVLDLAWFLVSSVEPERWSEAVDAYGSDAGLVNAMPSVMVQGYLSMADWPEGSEEAMAWNARLAAAAAML